MTINSFLARRVLTANPSATKAVTLKAKQLRDQGRDIITLSQGELDFDTPQPIREAARTAMDQGQTRYTEVAGSAELRQAVQHKFQSENGLNYSLDQIQVASGAKQILFNAFQATLNEGDEVLIPTPSWPSYPEMVRLASGEPRLLRCGENAGFKLTPEQLRAAINDNTKWLLLNNPANPSGALYTQSELRALGEVLQDYPQVWVIADEIYEHLRYDDQPFTSFAAAVPELSERTLTINGLSKAWAMTGWRVGYCAGPEPLIKALNLLQSQSTSHASSISQAAALSALKQPHTFITECVTELTRRRDLVVASIQQIPGLSCRVPQGAFYVFVNCQSLLGQVTAAGQTLDTDQDVALYLLEEADVAVVPGSAFDLPGYFRLSYGNALPQLEEAMRRISVACNNLVAGDNV
ncbi:pyridoxal phosphate-dependent aminotransferase [Oceanimonas baumannii]|uniref:Aminotransferase n=1 Tax=Oceanimonas baumannii TaxID=129578 RepID=A0A235CJI4_9GAMM|nr:pyridoxal phosphate-dependent aminotransferase [Oceanimonas baumannii]OYD24005.1 aspartate aminotransferase [Oceanimonas baumannii]TDW58654.1 aspartate aminotransferase [Oceanimonas baumannii]